MDVIESYVAHHGSSMVARQRIFATAWFREFERANFARTNEIRPARLPPKERKTMATIYVVQPGDALSRIARDHGTTSEAIKAANPDLIASVHAIRAGWKLLIPGPGESPPAREDSPLAATDSGDTYAIKAGDTLWELATDWGVTVEAIARLNSIADPGQLHLGLTIKKPTGANGASSSPTTTITNDDSPPGPLVSEGLVFTRIPLESPYTMTGDYLDVYEGNSLHVGVDLAGIEIGRPIFAPAGGTLRVHRVGDGTGFDSFGNCVVINHHGTPYWSIYAHMDSTPHETGDVVSTGDVLGFVGWTGKVLPRDSSARHLHWQVSDNEWFPKSEARTRNPALFFAAGIRLPGTNMVGASPDAFGQCKGTIGGPRPRRGGPAKPKKKFD